MFRTECCRSVMCIKYRKEARAVYLIRRSLRINPGEQMYTSRAA